MKATPKTAFLFLFMLISLSWGINCVAPIFETNTEKNMQDKRVALPGSESDVEEKTFELVPESLPSYDIPFVTLIATELQFSKETTLPESVFLTLFNPPPKLNVIA